MRIFSFSDLIIGIIFFVILGISVFLYSKANKGFSIGKITNRLIKVLSMTIAIISAVVLTVMLGLKIYRNTDGYKFKTALTAVENGYYSYAKEELYEINTLQAEVTLNFIEVEEKMIDFSAGVYSDKDFYIDTAYEKYLEFENVLMKFREENEIDLLPESLNEKYWRYLGAFGIISEYFDLEEDTKCELYKNFVNLQQVAINLVEYDGAGEDKPFSISNHQYRIKQTKDALEYFSDKDYSFIQLDYYDEAEACITQEKDVNGKTVRGIYTSQWLKDKYNYMVDDIKTAVEKSEKQIEDMLKKHDLNAQLYNSSPNLAARFDFSRLSGLKSIKEDEDILKNTEDMINTLKCDILNKLIGAEYEYGKTQ